MSFHARAAALQARQRTLLCVGLDPDPLQFPLHWRGNREKIFEFCAAIVDACADLVCAFKPQIAYFAAHRAEDQLERLIAHIQARGIPVILDAKRGDIGPTAALYAAEAFERYRADALTLSPYLGGDSLAAYQSEAYKDKGLFVLCRTSNPDSRDLQDLSVQTPASALNPGDEEKERPTHPGQEPLYERVAQLCTSSWSKNGGNPLGLVVGATWPEQLARIRRIAPASPLLIPGIGAQGGDLRATLTALACANKDAGLVFINVSRAVLYADASPAFASAAAQVASDLVRQMRQIADL